MVSVIVPIYKVEEYLPRCIDSILAQTYANLEIILVDDGSPDNCGAICDAYAQKDSRIVVIHKENGGVSAARNQGLKIAKGQYIAFVDSDDWVHSEYIALLVKGLNTGADLAICTMIETTKMAIDDMPIEPCPYKLFDKNECFYQMLHSKKIGGFLCNKLFKKELIVNTLNENIYCSEDFVFCAQYAEGIQQAVVIDTPLYYYWKNLDSVTNMYGVFNDKFFSLLEAEKQLREIYIKNLPAVKDDITLNLLKVALNLYGRYKYNKCRNLKQELELKRVIKQYYPEIKKSKKIAFKEKINIFITKRFPVLLLKVKVTILGRKLKR